MIKEFDKYVPMKNVITKIYKDHPFISVHVTYRNLNNEFTGDSVIYYTFGGFSIDSIDGKLYSLLDGVKKYNYDHINRELIIYK